MNSIDRKLGELDGKVEYIKEDLDGIGKKLDKILPTIALNQKAIKIHLKDHRQKEQRNLTIAGLFAMIVAAIVNIIFRR